MPEKSRTGDSQDFLIRVTQFFRDAEPSKPQLNKKVFPAAVDGRLETLVIKVPATGPNESAPEKSRAGISLDDIEVCDGRSVTGGWVIAYDASCRARATPTRSGATRTSLGVLV